MTDKIGAFNRDPNHIPDTQTTRGRTVSYEDSNFQTGDSPLVLDVNTDLGRNGRDGYILNEGAGNIIIEVSDDGSNYGGQHTVPAGFVFYLEGLDLNKIRLTWVADTSYKAAVV